MSSGLGIDYAMKTDEALQKRRAQYSYGTVIDSKNNDESIFKGNNDSSNTCTDGKDDGKIGFWSAAWSMTKGAAKGVWNGIKGCFTDSEGKFSIGKTLLTVGVGALCVAFPVVGLAACAVGGVMGGSKIVKGIINASNATTDAAKKDAFENIGDGALTVASSLVGVKASYGAVKATSTAGIDDALKGLDNVDDALKQVDDISNALKANGLDNIDDTLKGIDNVDDTIKAAAKLKAKGKASAWDQLDDTASNLDKLKAIGKDSWSSTKNQGFKLKEIGKAGINSHKATKAQKEADDIAAELAKAQENAGNQDDITKLQQSFDKAQENANKLKEAFDNSSEKDTITKFKDSLAKRKQVRKARKQAKKDVIEKNTKFEEAQTNLDKAKADCNTARKELVEAKAKVSEKAGNIMQKSIDKSAVKSKTTMAQTAKNNLDTAQSNLDAAQEALKASKEALKNTSPFARLKAKLPKGKKISIKDINYTNFKKLCSSVPEKYQNIIKALHDDSKTYNQVVQEFGWRDTAETLLMIQGFMKTTSSEI